MKRSGMLVAKFELNPYRRPIWAWLGLYLTPRRYHLNGIGVITSRCSGKEPALVGRTRETGGNRAKNGIESVFELLSLLVHPI